MEFPLNPEVTYFARTNFRGTDQIFGIKRKDRRQHTYVLGKSGTGKSVMLENMIIQNIKNGEGVCVVDPHGELAEKILESIPVERANDVVYFNPADTDNPIGFNVLQLDDLKYKHLVASGLMGIFTKIWANAWSSRMEYILSNAVLALLDSPDTTLLGIPRLLVDKDYRQYIINNLKDPVVKAFWVHEYEAWRDQFRNEAIAPIQNKVGQFLSSAIVRNVVGQSKSTVDIFNIMNEKKIFIVNVSKGRIGEDNSALLGGMIITKIQLAAMERVRIAEQERKDFYLYIDEFQNFSTESFGSILSEARKYRLCLIIAHQYTAQLDETVRDAVFGNVGTMIIFRVGADDADTVEKEFAPEFEVEDFVNLPNYHIYTKLMVDGVTSRPFSAKTLPPIDVDTTPEIRQEVINTSRKLYTKPREIVEAEIERWSSTVPGQKGLDEGDVSSGKFKVECSNDKKVIYVPFEPAPGIPVYCKECLFKIKNGELAPLPGYRAPREKKDTISYDSLAALGIEFQNQPTVSKFPPKEFKKDTASPVKSFGQKIQNAVGEVTGIKKPAYSQNPIQTQNKNNVAIPVINKPTQGPLAPKSTPIVDRQPQSVPVIKSDTTPKQNNTFIQKQPEPIENKKPYIPTKPLIEKVPVVETKEVSSSQVQQPKQYIKQPHKQHTQNEKPAPDVAGLREMLSRVVNTVVPEQPVQKIEDKNHKTEQKIFIDPFKDVQKVEIVPEKTMSLKDLIKKDDTTTSITKSIPKKEATDESRSLLQQALDQSHKEMVEVKNPIFIEKEQIAAPAVSTDIVTDIIKPESTNTVPAVETINNTENHITTQNQNLRQDFTPSHENNSIKIKEVPEDLLRKILEE